MAHSKEELKHRVMAKKHQLQEKLEKVKADAHGQANEETKQIESKLEELSGLVQKSWDDLSESAMDRLEKWLE